LLADLRVVAVAHLHNEVVHAGRVAMREIVDSAAHRTEELLVAAFQRTEMRRKAEVPFANECGGIAGIAQGLTHGDREHQGRFAHGFAAMNQMVVEAQGAKTANDELIRAMTKTPGVEAEIAAARATSERTIRAQARSIYAKAGLSGRAALSAFFLEDLLAPNEHVNS